MEPFGATLRKAFTRPLEKSPRQPGFLDWLVWKLFFARWDRLIEENPRLAREMHHVGRAWFLTSPIAAPSSDAQNAASMLAEATQNPSSGDTVHQTSAFEGIEIPGPESQSQRRPRLSAADVPSFSASATAATPAPASVAEPIDLSGLESGFESAPKVARIHSVPTPARDAKASASRLRQPRQSTQQNTAESASSAA